jgi:hypothetical protein
MWELGPEFLLDGCPGELGRQFYHHTDTKHEHEHEHLTAFGNTLDGVLWRRYGSEQLNQVCGLRHGTVAAFILF